jgi:hypothetical protein
MKASLFNLLVIISGNKAKLMIKQSFLIILFFLIISPALINAQELDPIVDVDVTSLNADVRDRLSDFKNDITNYLTKTKFTDEAIVNDVKGKPYKIKCNYQIFFTSSTGFTSYAAQVVIFVQRNIFKSTNFTSLIKIKDDSWNFDYIRGQSFYHDDLKFNTLTSFLDYYAYMIIGLDDDSWEYKLGDKRFQKARDIVNLASVNSSTNPGWTNNSSLVVSRNSYPQELLDSKYENYRKGFWMYHFAGIDSIKFNKRTALERMAEAIDLIGKTKRGVIKSFVIKAFFEAKYLEIAQTLVDYYDKTIYRRLSEIDPDHASTYDEFSKK